MLQAITAGALLISSLISPATAAAAAPVPQNKMTITVVGVNGSGCPLGSADVTVSRDGTAFTVTYSQFTAQTGVGTLPTEFRRNCQLALDVHVPGGFTYAIDSTDYRGFAHLERGASGTETAFYYFQGEPQTRRIKHDFVGYMDGDWQRTDTVGVASLSFSPCGERRFLNVNTELRVNGGQSDRTRTTSFLTMDSTDGELDTTYHVAFRRC